jgi:hypothetical protein
MGMSLIEEQNVFLTDVAKLIQKAQELGYVITGGELYRTIAQEELYVKQGLSETMHSNHLRRLAIDLNCFRDGVLVVPSDLGEFWEELNPLNRWGGNFSTLKDTDHFERNSPGG